MYENMIWEKRTPPLKIKVFVVFNGYFVGMRNYF